MEIATASSSVEIKPNTVAIRAFSVPDLTSLQQARNVLVDVRSRFDLQTVERSIKAMQAVSRVQGVDQDLQKRCFAELHKYKLIKEILDSDAFL